VQYTLNLLNDGTAAASGAQAHLTIPSVAGVTLVANSWSASSGSVGQAAGQINWTASGPLPIGAVVKISFRVKITGVLVNGTAIPSSATTQATGTLPPVLMTKATYSSVGQAPNNLLYLPLILR